MHIFVWKNQLFCVDCGFLNLQLENRQVAQTLSCHYKLSQSLGGSNPWENTPDITAVDRKCAFPALTRSSTTPCKHINVAVESASSWRWMTYDIQSPPTAISSWPRETSTFKKTKWKREFLRFVADYATNIQLSGHCPRRPPEQNECSTKLAPRFWKLRNYFYSKSTFGSSLWNQKMKKRSRKSRFEKVEIRHSDFQQPEIWSEEVVEKHCHTRDSMQSPYIRWHETNRRNRKRGCSRFFGLVSLSWQRQPKLFNWFSRGTEPCRHLQNRDCWWLFPIEPLFGFFVLKIVVRAFRIHSRFHWKRKVVKERKGRAVFLFARIWDLDLKSVRFNPEQFFCGTETTKTSSISRITVFYFDWFLVEPNPNCWAKPLSFLIHTILIKFIGLALLDALFLEQENSAQEL